jgi:ribosomal protein S18 acetylase RimI-like enzyme
MNSRIRTCTQDDIGILTETIGAAFEEVAARFGLTRENAPSHPSHCTAKWIQKDMDRGVTYFIIENGDLVAGCVALESAKPGVCYLERLAVLPCRRRRGLGKALVNHVFAQAKSLGLRRVNIGIIAEDTELKNWYKRMGFIEGKSKAFSHLPFDVTFMSYRVD